MVKRIYRFVIGFLLIVAGLVPSWEWSLTHKEVRLGIEKSPLVRISAVRVRNDYGVVLREESTRSFNFFSGSGGFILAGLLVMAIGSRGDGKKPAVGQQPPSPPAA